MTYQDKLYYKFYKIYPNSEVKKINKDTSLDIYVPGLHEKRNIHVNFNIKGGGGWCFASDGIGKIYITS